MSSSVCENMYVCCIMVTRLGQRMPRLFGPCHVPKSTIKATNKHGYEGWVDELVCYLLCDSETVECVQLRKGMKNTRSIMLFPRDWIFQENQLFQVWAIL